MFHQKYDTKINVKPQQSSLKTLNNLFAATQQHQVVPGEKISGKWCFSFVFIITIRDDLHSHDDQMLNNFERGRGGVRQQKKKRGTLAKKEMRWCSHLQWGLILPSVLQIILLAFLKSVACCSENMKRECKTFMF